MTPPTAPFNVLYFGCLRRLGHGLHDTSGRSMGLKEVFGTPWGTDIDGGMLAGKPYTEGIVYYEQRGGWSAIDFCDYSVDSRPGSHSMFLTNSLVSSQLLLEEARAQWPGVFARLRAPLRFAP